MMTEYGADTIAGLHDVDPVMFTVEFQVEYLRANHEVFDEFNTFVGEQVWNFADFNTSQGIIRVQGNKKGIFTRIGSRNMPLMNCAKDGWLFQSTGIRNSIRAYGNCTCSGGIQ